MGVETIRRQETMPAAAEMDSTARMLTVADLFADMQEEILQRPEVKPTMADIDSSSEIPDILGALNEIADPEEALWLLDKRVGVKPGGALYKETSTELAELKAELVKPNGPIEDGADETKTREALKKLDGYQSFAAKTEKFMELRFLRGTIVEVGKLKSADPELYPAPTVQYAITCHLMGRLRKASPSVATCEFVTSMSDTDAIIHALFMRKTPKEACSLLKDEIGAFEGGTLHDVVQIQVEALRQRERDAAARNDITYDVHDDERLPVVDKQARKLLELRAIAQKVYYAALEEEPHRRNLHYGLNSYYVSKLKATGNALSASKAVAIPDSKEPRAGALALRDGVDVDPFTDVNIALMRAMSTLGRGIYNLAEKGGEALERLVQKIMTDTRRAIGTVVLTAMTSGNTVSVPPQEMRALAAAVISEQTDPNNMVEVASAVPGELAAAPAEADALPSPPPPEAPPEVLTPQEETAMLAQRVIDHPLIHIPQPHVLDSIVNVTNDGKTYLYGLDHAHEGEVLIDPQLWKVVMRLADAGIETNITSLTTSHLHAKNSSHYDGKGIDLTFASDALYDQAFENLYTSRTEYGLHELILGGPLPEGTQNLLNGEPYDKYSQNTLNAHAGDRKHIHFSVIASVNVPPEPPVAPEVAPSQGEHTVEQFMAAIASQESRGNPNAKNGRTKAHGYFQILPSNWPAWSAETFGEVRDRSPENQILVAKFKMEQYYQALGSWEAVAIAWFAGPAAAQKYANGDHSVLSRSDGIWTVNKYVTNMQEHIGKIDPNAVLPILNDVLANPGPAPAPAPPPVPDPVIRVAKPPKVIEEAAPPAKGRVQKLLDVLRVVPGIEGAPLLPAPDEAANNHPGKGPKVGRK